MREFGAIREANPLHPMEAVALQGRRHLCLLVGDDPEVAGADAIELSEMCRDRKRGTEDPSAFPRDCGYYRTVLEGRAEPLVSMLRGEAPDAETLVSRAQAIDACPYELTRLLLPSARVVAAPYPYFFHPQLRASLLTWMRTRLDALVVIVDEAHNLPDYAREVATARLTRTAVLRARSEVAEFGDQEVQGVALSRFLDALATATGELCAEVSDDEGPVAPGELEARLLSAFSMTTRGLEAIVAALFAYGEAVREKRRRAGRVPRSYASGVASFLEAWGRFEEPEFLPVALKEGELVLWPLEASVTTRPLLEAHASVHLSGTLTPLEEYRDAIGLPENTPLVRFPSPFAPQQRLARFSPELTTRYEDVARDPSLFDRLVSEIDRLVLGLGRRTAVFFASHEAMARALKRTRIVRPLVEREGMGQRELMALVARFRAEGGTIVGVLGGRIAEGLDFPAGELEVVIVAGLPYPRPTFRQRALVRYYDMRFSRGFDYAVHAPMQRRVLQAAGRLIRGPEDTGVLVILDHRAERLAPAIEGLHPSPDPLEEARAFLAKAPATTEAL